jgi:phosphatidylglycerophosphate synthase
VTSPGSTRSESHRNVLRSGSHLRPRAPLSVEPRQRRPLRTRGRASAAALAGWLGRRQIKPNEISLASIAIAAGGAACFALLPHVGDAAQLGLLAVAAALIQLRLLANLMDGMLAIEGGRQSQTGPLFNEIPDRIADVLLLAAAGYAVTWFSWGETLGWAAAVAAVLTAYVRVLGGSLGLEENFCGPMAKPHRMAVLTAACVLSMIEVAYGYEGRVLAVALAVIAAGSILTFARRTRLLARELSGQ